MGSLEEQRPQMVLGQVAVVVVQAALALHQLVVPVAQAVQEELIVYLAHQQLTQAVAEVQTATVVLTQETVDLVEVDQELERPL
jgi:hypothetical protein